MARTKATLGAGARLADYLAVGYLALNCPLHRVRQALTECGAQSQRRRGLPHEVLVYYVMCMCLYRRAAYEEVLRIVVEGLRGIYGEQIGQTLVNKAAISLARTRVGVEPFEWLYRCQVRPVGPQGMPGVWYQGLRVMGLDGSTLEVPDEAANALYFGYPGASRGTAAFPQMRFCALSECGTQVLIGAKLAPYSTSEQTLAHEVLEHADASMLIIADRGFAGWPLWQRALQTGARLLFRVRDNQVLPVRQLLADGSYLSELYEHTKARRHGKGLTVRVIEYQLQGSGEIYRLVTNWLEHEVAPAEELAALYHRRWKIETALAEIKTQLNDALTLRSKTPVLVQQEFYALLMAHAAIRSLMTRAAHATDQASEDLSFIHAVQVLRRRLPAQAALPPSAA